jgi:hypothetical protein
MTKEFTSESSEISKINQWLKRPLLNGPSIERSGKLREIRGKMVSNVDIQSIISIP